jgi:hypothetical protein
MRSATVSASSEPARYFDSGPEGQHESRPKRGVWAARSVAQSARMFSIDGCCDLHHIRATEKRTKVTCIKRASFPRKVAFDDASRRPPSVSCPRHNLA